MAERHEHSYYEIVLTGGQMIVAFVVVLGCLLAAFFAGVYVGRDGAAPTRIAEAESGQGEVPEGAAEDDVGLGQFDFFSEGEPQGAPRQPLEIARQADAETSLRDDVLGEERADRQPEPPSPPPAVEPAPAVEPPRQPPPQPAPAEPEPAQPAPAQPARAASGGLVIQVFSTDNYEQAQQVLERLRASDLPAFISPQEIGGRTMHRVRVGPYGERARAEQVAQRVRESHRLDTWITQADG